MMKTKILTTLKQIEKECNVKILFAAETGSRAWGFASPDSDYDVRFIYMHNKNWYLSLSEKRDTVERMLDDGLLDITGRDLRKTLQLLKKPNISIFERLYSPEIYFADDYFKDEIMKILPEFFSPISGMYHYLSMASGFMKDMVGKDEVKLKSYFYALRATLSSLWIKKNQTMPPIEFNKLLFLLDDKQKIKVQELLSIKSRMDEKYHHKKEAIIDTFLEETIEDCKLIANDLHGSKRDSKSLDEFFLNILNEVN